MPTGRLVRAGRPAFYCHQLRCKVAESQTPSLQPSLHTRLQRPRMLVCQSHLPQCLAMTHLFGSDSWLYIILVGFVVGLLARFITPGTQRLGCLLTSVLGIAGAVVASWFGRYMGWYHAGEPAGFLGALLGAIAILALLRVFSGSKR